jgi:hypothetical protein
MFDKQLIESSQFRFKILDLRLVLITWKLVDIDLSLSVSNLESESEIVMRSEIGDTLYSSRQTKYKALSSKL